MKIQYIGDKSEMKNVYGYDFSWRAVVDIPEDDTLVIRKLSNNSHFKVVDEGESASIIAAQTPAPEPHEPESTEEAEPVAKAKAVTYGIFRVKENGEKYSKADKVCDTQEEVDAYLKESGLTREDRLVLVRDA